MFDLERFRCLECDFDLDRLLLIGLRVFDLERFRGLERDLDLLRALASDFLCLSFDLDRDLFSLDLDLLDLSLSFGLSVRFTLAPNIVLFSLTWGVGEDELE